MPHARIVQTARIALGLLGLLLLTALAVPASDARSSDAMSMVTPVKAAPVCKEVIGCKNCRPVYRCRSCRKWPICIHGVCHYRTLCGWGPTLKSLPKGARVVRVR
ncbi:hypothetical protein [Methyloceanibacter methanicus]|uniref:hypothetical protein n=1 Tax=Methyloceanibacter methanicus TaxID=1774968 RepID=UPI00114CE889|nr:hypothetical protein [Methyloceanibacter methanicus]